MRGMRTRIVRRKPVAYIVNTAYFQGEEIFVDERVIIPRSYLGEILVSDENHVRIHTRPVHAVLDLCTGSGCLAILASKVFPEAEVIHAIDKSPACIEVASINIRAKGLERRIVAAAGDLFDFPHATKYDLIICNPPYVDRRSMDALPSEYRHEPISALAAGEDGMSILTRLLIEAPRFLTEEGSLLCEVGLRADDLLRRFPNLEDKIEWLKTRLSKREVFLVKRSVLHEACASPSPNSGG